MTLAARDRLIVALDLPRVERRAGDGRRGSATRSAFYKVGYQLTYAGGLDFRRAAWSLRQAGVHRPQAARHRQHGGARRRERRQARRDVPHRACLSADDAGGGGGRGGLAPAHSRRDGADILRRRRHRGGRLCRSASTIWCASARTRRTTSASTASCARPRRPGAAPHRGPGMVLVTPGVRPAGVAHGRPEAHHDAGPRDRERRGLSRGRPPDHGDARPEARRGSDRGGDRTGRCIERCGVGLSDRTQRRRGRRRESATIKEKHDGEGILGRARRCQRPGGLQGLRRGQCGAAQEIRRTLSGARRQGRSPEGSRASRNVVLEFPSYEAALACYNSPEYQPAIALRTPHSTADIIIIEGYDGPAAVSVEDRLRSNDSRKGVRRPT